MRAKLKAIEQIASDSKFVKVEGFLFLHRENGFFYVIKSFKRYKIPNLFKSTKEKTIKKARAKAEELIADHMSEYLGSGHTILGKRVGTPVRTVIEEILRTVTPSRRAGTQEMHRIYLGELSREWGSWDVGRINLDAWQTWLVGFRKRKNRKTYCDYSKHMNLVLNYAYQQRYASHLIKLPNPDKAHEASFRVYTHEEIKTLWSVMNDDTRDQFVLSYECFMRLREVLYLTWSRVDLDKGVVTLRASDVKTGSKTGKGRSFYLSPRALERLRARRKRIDSPYVFPSPENPNKPMHQNKTAWVIAKRKAGITGRARWHDLRHSALSHALLERKESAILVSEFAGVSVRTIQQVYLHSRAEQTAQVSQAVSIGGFEKDLKKNRRGKK